MIYAAVFVIAASAAAFATYQIMKKKHEKQMRNVEVQLNHFSEAMREIRLSVSKTVAMLRLKLHYRARRKAYAPK